MRNTNPKFILLIFLFVLTCCVAKTQVTIGSSIMPNAGALLDLKENQSSELTTATKGIIFPRVNLADRTKLYPMFSENDPAYTGEAMKTQNELHTGLLVYNMGISNNIGAGLFVWDGTRWIPLLGNKETTPPDPGEGNIVTDHEGNDYLIGKFPNAGWWTLQNARPLTLPNGDAIPFSKESDKDDPAWADQKRIFYPDAEPDTETAPATHKDKYGMLYSWDAAMAGETPSTEKPYIRGICPAGWHMPSDSEWMQLEKTLAEGTAGGWDDNWGGDYSEGYRGKYGKIFKSSTKVERLGSDEGAVPETGGDSPSAQEGGFDIYLVGSHKAGATESESDYSLHYGIMAKMWTSSQWQYQAGIHAVRKFSSTEQGVDRNGSADYFLASVRCKKD